MAEEIIDIFRAVQVSTTAPENSLEGKIGACPTSVSEIATKSDIVAGPDENIISYHDIMTEEFESNDTRIAMIGNVDSGKSTLIGVLANSTLDDGRGFAR
jgi:polynucleotide 5'-kinase involved in rRNA processing